MTEAAASHGEDVAVFCAGVKGAFALDDAYVAGRVADGIGAERSDAAEAAVRLRGRTALPRRRSARPARAAT